MTLVDEDTLEARLAAIAASAPGEQEGAFGPQSMRWRIDREAALFLGAGRALLLQLAHPWVAAAVAQHSHALSDPIGRFHGTFATVFAMVFGSLADAVAASRALHRRHDTIQGTFGDSSEIYVANDRAALQWVHATLTQTALQAYGLVLPLERPMLDGYYAESRRFAGFFGLAADELPPDFEAFRTYCGEMVDGSTLAVGETARTIAARLLAGAGSWIIIPEFYRALTAVLLPPALADAYGLPRGEREERLAAKALDRIRRFYPRLPARLRYVGPYHEARERLSGRRLSLSTRLSNRFWIGRSSLGAPR
ncbi:MAG TPA: oxygenase MpaB family protein [Stellaceae bacterium]|nr:oxygenase MpaB family protein [Stellaceae bacterium]